MAEIIEAFVPVNVGIDEFLDVSSQNPDALLGTIRDSAGHVVDMAQWVAVEAVSNEDYKKLKYGVIALGVGLVVALAGGGYLLYRNKKLNDQNAQLKAEKQELVMSIEEIKIEMDKLRELLKTRMLDTDEARKYAKLQKMWIVA
ncbi:MAG: hypothetical protein LBT37_05340 [Lactobacillaceae bacterium]|jgi:cell division protein FtsB|nr:hypothetical protein [Lactobacillaceae bacterium]